MAYTYIYEINIHLDLPLLPGVSGFRIGGMVQLPIIANGPYQDTTSEELLDELQALANQGGLGYVIVVYSNPSRIMRYDLEIDDGGHPAVRADPCHIEIDE